MEFMKDARGSSTTIDNTSRAGQILLMTAGGRIDFDKVNPDVPVLPSELRLEAFDDEHIGVNRLLPHLAGRARFEYQAIASHSRNDAGNALGLALPIQQSGVQKRLQRCPI